MATTSWQSTPRGCSGWPPHSTNSDPPSDQHGPQVPPQQDLRSNNATEPAKVLVDDTDRRPVAEKLEAIFKGVDPAVGGAFVERITQLDEDTITHMVRFYSRRDYQRYLRRMLGEGGLHRLRQAASEDFDILLTLLYRAIDVVTPYAVAIEEMAGALDEQQVRKFMNVYPAGGFLLRLMFELCDALDVMVDKVMVPEVMEVLSGLSRYLVRELSATLDRKLRGAKDALAFSADSNSQAANSLIEFIDRLLRNAFSDEEVLN